MRRAFTFVLLCSFSVGCFAEELRLQGSKIVLPEGQVIGAALSGDLIFIQQAVFHADGPIVRASRQLLSWNTTTNSVVTKRILAGNEPGFVADGCNRVEAFKDGQRILICENYKTLVILGADTLDPISEIHCDGYIYDFAVDGNSQRAFVASRSDPDTQFLTIFDITSGKQIRQTKISTGSPEYVQIVADSRSKMVAVAQIHFDHSGVKTTLYGCGYMGAIACEYVTTLKQVSQLAIWGREVLLASGELADDRHVCLTSVNLSSHATTREYCSPRTGVHYGVGVIDGRYVIGYTGIEGGSAWKELTFGVNSSVSVWRYESQSPAAKVAQDGANGSFPHGARIASSETAPRFLLYSGLSNIAYLYSISDEP